MLKLNVDILYLIFKELQYNKNAFLSCLIVNKTWCKMIVPILWKDPWKYMNKEVYWKHLKSTKSKELLFNVIISHLLEESRNNLKNQGVNILTNVYQRPLFNYISFCKHLNLRILDEIITYNLDDNTIGFSTVRKEIINLFINENTRITHLIIPYQFDYQLHLIPGAKSCFSELEFFSCNMCINDDILFGLTEICQSIKELELFIEKDNNYGIVKLVESSKKLFNVRLIINGHSKNDSSLSFCKVLENSLIKHAITMQDFMITEEPTTKILSSFENLIRLELGYISNKSTWNCLENLSLPILQILKAKGVPIKVLTNIIKNTNGYLLEINIDEIFCNEIDNEKFIQIIYQKCLKLKYLKILVRSCNILEFEKLLINCQYLNGLYIIIKNDIWFDDSDHTFNWNLLFEALIKSSPNSLFKFKFYFDEAPDLKSLELFLDNWKGKRSMLLQTIQKIELFCAEFGIRHLDLIQEYKTKGIVKKYDHDDLNGDITFEDFEWIQKNI
ncbi:hypothetical protein RclHR1_15090004 [Rhizophagus clarus]|uniref:F-box domain-containing protein n=1 Tax=Rhizophagus clarus TaxID=94130 RepID=A0A2Z6QG51_9GLOM|nr:hypothetical protein RclHR1_15090004 [Rhizophagus clarus]GES77276.1 hypothetical protein GLOIN_2v1784964 [Rhizophagus clarus]